MGAISLKIFPFKGTKYDIFIPLTGIYCVPNARDKRQEGITTSGLDYRKVFKSRVLIEANMGTDMEEVMRELELIRKELHDIRRNMSAREMFLTAEEKEFLYDARENARKGNLVSSWKLRETLALLNIESKG